MEWCGGSKGASRRPSSLFALHAAKRGNGAENGRGLQPLYQLLLLAVAAVDVKLQADMLARVAATHVLHQPMMNFQDAVHLVADLFDAGSGDLVTREQDFEIKRL